MRFARPLHPSLVSRHADSRRPLRKRVPLAVATMLAFGLSTLAQGQARVCFDQAGTAGTKTITTSGPGCGTFLTFGGITGVWMGDTSVTENCTFTIAPPANGTTMTVALTAHSCNGIAFCEEARFSVNGSHYAVLPAELDPTMPPGGTPVSITVAGDILGSPVGSGDGHGTITFAHAPGSVTSLDINHVVTMGAPAGTIYLVCVDDAPGGPGGGVVTPVPTLAEWALYGLALLLGVVGLGTMRRRRG